MDTRGLQSFATARISGDPVVLFYAIGVENDDGSEDISYEKLPALASVVPLTTADYKRLETGGIVVKDGVTIVLPFGTKKPDKITHNTFTYRIVAWANANGATICTGDKITVTPVAPVEAAP